MNLNHETIGLPSVISWLWHNWSVSLSRDEPSKPIQLIQVDWSSPVEYDNGLWSWFTSWLLPPSLITTTHWSLLSSWFFMMLSWFIPKPWSTITLSYYCHQLIMTMVYGCLMVNQLFEDQWENNCETVGDVSRGWHLPSLNLKFHQCRLVGLMIRQEILHTLQHQWHSPTGKVTRRLYFMLALIIDLNDLSFLAIGIDRSRSMPRHRFIFR